MARCQICHQESIMISSFLGVCRRCILEEWSSARSLIWQAHARAREMFHLPPQPPRDPNGLPCNLCINQCQVGEGQVGYCGVRRNHQGRWALNFNKIGFFSAYHDPLPTNCVADWVCPGGSPAGYPRFSYSPGAEFGYTNLAVFFHSCTFDCLYCQNWSYRQSLDFTRAKTASSLLGMIDRQTACLCYFGGDPASQLTFTLEVSQKVLQAKAERKLRICWETNGSFHPRLVEPIAALALESGGCIKIDLKAWHEELNLALCGVSNKWTLENFRHLAEFISQRPDPPLLIASTLLVPGYIEEEEVAKLAEFIARINPEIPYSLLAFHPQFLMKDLPPTSRKQAEKCYEAARRAGLRRIHLGNIHLLH